MNTEEIRQRLLETRDELRARERSANAALRQQPDVSTMDYGDISKRSEGSGDLTALSRTTDVQLQQVENALLRLEEGRYNVCASCGQEIEPQRLEAVPYADRCIQCAEADEAAAGRA